MKYFLWLVLLVLLNVAGCLNLPRSQDAQPKPKALEIKRQPPPPTVTPDEVTETNWAQKIDPFRAELDYDETNLPAAPPRQPVIHTVDGSRTMGNSQ